MVGILILIHQHIAELILVIGQHFRLLLKQCNRVINNIVKIHGVGGAKPLGVGGINFGHPAQLPVRLIVVFCCKILRTLIPVLGASNDAQDALRQKRLFVQIQLLYDILDHPLRVVGIVNGKILVKPDSVGIPPQNPNTGGVKSGRPDIVCGRPQTGGQAVFQLPRRFVGKGNSDNLPRTRHIYSAEAADPIPLRLIRML